MKSKKYIHKEKLSFFSFKLSLVFRSPFRLSCVPGMCKVMFGWMISKKVVFRVTVPYHGEGTKSLM